MRSLALTASAFATVLSAQPASAALVDVSTYGRLMTGSGAFFAGQDYTFEMNYNDAADYRVNSDGNVEYAFFGQGFLRFAVGGNNYRQSIFSFIYNPRTSILQNFVPADYQPNRINFQINLNRTDSNNLMLPSYQELFGKAALVAFNGVSEGDYGPGGIRRFSSATALTQIGAVPEPTTWAFMIFGIGIIGSSLRRRHVGRPHSWAVAQLA